MAQTVVPNALTAQGATQPDPSLTMQDDEICAAVRDAFEDTRAVLEPAGALGMYVGVEADAYAICG